MGVDALVQKDMMRKSEDEYVAYLTISYSSKSNKNGFSYWYDIPYDEAKKMIEEDATWSKQIFEDQEELDYEIEMK